MTRCAAIVSGFVLSGALCSKCEGNFFSHSSTITTQMEDMSKRFSSVIQTYQQRLYSNQYAPSTTFGRATLDTHSVANTLFIAYLYNYPEFGVRFLKVVRLTQRSTVCCECVSQMSWCVDTNCNNCYRW